MKDTITIGLADSSEIFREGIKKMLQGSPFKVTTEAKEPRFIELVMGTDIVLCEAKFAGGTKGPDGLWDASRALEKHPDRAKVVILSNYNHPAWIANAVARPGFYGWLLKNDLTQDRLLAALEEVAGDEKLFTRGELRIVTGAMATPRADFGLEAPLTNREVDVLKQIAQGLSNKEIAGVLGISYETVKEHVQHVLRKLWVSDRTQAAVWAVREGLV